MLSRYAALSQLGIMGEPGFSYSAAPGYRPGITLDMAYVAAFVNPTKHWRTPGEQADAERNARELGKQEALKEIFQRVAKTIVSRAEDIGTLTSVLLREIAERGFVASHAFLNIESPDRFKVLIAVRPEDHTDERFLEIYSLAHRMRADTKPRYSLEFEFLGVTEEDLDLVQVEADGYVREFSETTTHDAERSRTPQ